MVGFLVTLILGGLAGYIASLIVNRNQSMGIFWNIVVGILGAFVANLLIAPLFGGEAVLDRFTLSGFLWSVVGAVVLLAVVNIITRKRLR